MQKKLSADQSAIVAELTEVHGLDPEQISFEGNETTPIFDYEAVCALSLKLTDITNIQSEIADRDFNHKYVTARCEVNLPDGKSRVAEDSASVGETIGDGKTIETMRMAEIVAQSRAVRRGIRSVGVNLFKAHKKFMENGEVVSGQTMLDPRLPHYQEVHKIAGKLGLIVGSDKREYHQYLAEMFDGRISCSDLDDLELQRLIVSLRAMNRLKIANLAVSTQKAA